MDKIKDRYLFIIPVILLIIRYCLACYSVRVVDGESMYPTLHDQDRIYASELLPKLQGIHRGDIVGISTDLNSTPTRIIKRVIGLPNERVTLKDGVIYINGNRLEETYLGEDVYTDGRFDFQLSDRQYIVLGDNRSNSIDSRDRRLGIIHESEIDFTMLKVKERFE